ncbi:CHAT domain-containing protein [Laspinema olomoucense]|uniref:CHAT domain-containing protein n=1 Tax=Laspinema olomoucense TaxID=3231600 RepID=UPI0021BBADD2|nr:CHAT domain-containing protein [Laspinema sp. D3c]MCT7997545.1 CHAT domain-containing protein [Laspinema sp. D3c]
MARKRDIFYHSFRFILKLKFKLMVWAICGLIISLNLPVLSAQIGQGLSGFEENAHPALAQSIEPESLLEHARTAYQNGEFLEAAQLLKQAEAMFGDREAVVERAVSLSYLSLVYQKLGQWPEATEAIATSLSLLENTANVPLSVLARTLNAQGNLQLAQGQAEAALETWKQGEIAYQKAGDREGVKGSLMNQAKALESMGFSRAACNIVLEVLEVEGLTCESLVQSHDPESTPKRSNLDEFLLTLQQQPNSAIKAMALRSLGNLLRSFGYLERSEQILEQSLQVAETLQSPQEISLSLLNLGNTARAQEDFTHALAFYNQAAIVATSPATRLQAYLNQLSLTLEGERIATTLTIIDQIQSELDDLPTSAIAVYARINFARSLWQLRNQSNRYSLVQIEELLKIAQQQAEELGDDRLRSHALGNHAWLSEQKEDWLQAQQLTTDAIALAKDAPEIAYQWQWQMARVKQKNQENYSALQFYDAAIASLKSVRKDLTGINPDIQLSFQKQIDPLYREFVDLLLQGENPSTENLEKARQAIADLQLAELENFLRCSLQTETPVELDRLADEHQAAIIYPIVLPQRLAVIVKRPGSSDLLYFQTEISRQDVDQKLDTLRTELEERFVSTEAKQLLPEVYNWLIQPIETASNSQVIPIKTLVFVLEGRLRNIPMAALSNSNGEYVVQKYAVALNLGLELKDPQPLSQQSLTALLAGITEPLRGLPALEYADRELNLVENSVSSSRQLRNQKFKKETLENQINSRSFAIVHLATHGEFSSQLEKTGIEAWDGRINLDELSTIFTQQTENQPSPIELLVLSACKTAEGDDRAVLGLAGVAVRSGARSTVASLWYIDDETSALLMNRFYYYLNDPRALSKAEALRLAQDDIRKEFINKRAPYYWGSFVLVGNWL